MEFFTNTSYNTTNNTSGNDSAGETSWDLAREEDGLAHIAHVINTVVIPCVFVVGIVGNIINLVVFNQRSLNINAGVIEKSANTGLTTLALSDLLFCLVGFPALVLGNVSTGSSLKVAAFYYGVYKGPLLNIFLFSSTWLIAFISAERCLAVCFPFKARDIITVRRTVVSHSLVFVASLALNFPLFFTFKVASYQCTATSKCYITIPWWFFEELTTVGVHFILWSIVGTFLPLALLILCNAKILKSIYKRSKSSSSSAKSRSEELQTRQRMTWMLVTIVICFFVFVVPSIILQFTFRIVDASNFKHLEIANSVANLLQAIKFSGNFLLYCLLHKKFRETLRTMSCVAATNSYQPASLA